MAPVMSTHATIRAERADGKRIWLGPWRWCDGYMVRYYLDHGRRWCQRVPVLASIARPTRPLIAEPRSTR